MAHALHHGVAAMNITKTLTFCVLATATVTGCAVDVDANATSDGLGGPDVADSGVRTDRRVGDLATTASIPTPRCSVIATAAAPAPAQRATHGTLGSLEAASATTCGVTVTAIIDCVPSGLTHSRFQFGVLIDGEPSIRSSGDLREVCGRPVIQTFGVPCDAQSVVGAVTFDHPILGVATACVSDSL